MQLRFTKTTAARARQIYHTYTGTKHPKLELVSAIADLDIYYEIRDQIIAHAGNVTVPKQEIYRIQDLLISWAITDDAIANQFLDNFAKE